jgi:hypothetical protein
MVTLRMSTVKESLTGPSLSPPPCAAENSKHRDQSKDSIDILDHSRCEFTFSDGRRCRNQRASLCVHHNSKRRRNSGDASRRNVYQQDELSPLKEVVQSPELTALCADLTTATNINRALAQVFLLTAQGRISQKQAVAFGYLSQLLLQTVPGIRSEFVSAFGYHPWEQKLKQSLESHDNEGPDDSSPGGETPQQPIDKPIVDRRPFEERVMEPDYDSIVSRGRDLLAGKYSVTPEGRREAKTLDTELELMKPPAAKMPKGTRASVIEHMKRWIAQKKVPAARSLTCCQGIIALHKSAPGGHRRERLPAKGYQQDALHGVKKVIRSFAAPQQSRRVRDLKPRKGRQKLAQRGSAGYRENTRAHVGYLAAAGNRIFARKPRSDQDLRLERRTGARDLSGAFGR